MLKHSLAAGLLACAALTPVAFAQDAKPAQERSSISYIKDIEKEQFRSTSLVGKTVYNLQDENIGSISDLILDRSGKVAGVIIGVGGFLGLGQSDVAVPMNSLKFVPDDQAMAATSGAGSATGRAATDANAEKEPGAAGQPSGTSTSAALPNQNVADKGNAQQNAVEGAGQAKMDPAQKSAAKDADVAARTDAASKDASSSGYSTATADASADEDWLANMKVVLNTTREDLGSAPKLGETAADAPAK